MYVNMIAWVFGFMNEIGMFGMKLIMDLWLCDVLTWELDEGNERSGMVW